MPHYNFNAPLIRFIENHTNDSGQAYLYERFKDLDQHLVDNVHPTVGQGTAAIDGILLTDHGPDHISTVIRRITDLTLVGEKFMINPYEAYLLAVAAHFHDTGNILGREGHEKKGVSLVFDLEDSLIGSDTIEKRKIASIARAHGGREGASKDTIGAMPDDRDLRKLAAILRFADELAEDHTRTSPAHQKILDEDERIRKKSEIYHLYSQRLREVKVEHDARRVLLRFEVMPLHLRERYYKDGQRRFLLDEIFSRTLKVHREQVYCGKFMTPDVVSERTDVEICVCNERFERVLGRFHYTLEQKGYPDHVGDFRALVADDGIGGLRAASVARRINKVVTEIDDDDALPLDLNMKF